MTFRRRPGPAPDTAPTARTRARTWSIRRRLLTALLGILLVGLLGGPLVSSLLLRDFLQSRAAADLSGVANALGGFITARDGLIVTRERLDELPSRYGVLVVALDGTGSPLDLTGQPGPGTAPAVAEDLVAATGALEDGDTARVESSSRTFVVARVPSRGLVLQLNNGEAVQVAQLVLARDRTDDAVLLRRVECGGYAFAALALVVLGSMGAIVLKRGLRPIEEMAELMRGDEQPRGADVLEARLASLGHDGARETRRLAESLVASFAARRKAEEALRAFVADTSHELRTPLTTLSGWLELYAQGGLDAPDERDRAMIRIEAEVGRMRVIVEELDLLALLDRGRPLELEPVDLGTLLTGVVQDAAVVSPDRAITLDAPPGLMVHADRLRLEQVFRNLVGNAAQHTPPGSPIHVCCERRATAGGHEVLVRVVDHGAGIPQAQRAQIFERSHRAGTARRDGSGLGLAIVKGLVEAHNGQVGVESTADGATFIVALPVDARRVDQSSTKSQQTVR